MTPEISLTPAAESPLKAWPTQVGSRPAELACAIVERDDCQAIPEQIRSAGHEAVLSRMSEVKMNSAECSNSTTTLWVLRSKPRVRNRARHRPRSSSIAMCAHNRSSTRAVHRSLLASAHQRRLLRMAIPHIGWWEVKQEGGFPTAAQCCDQEKISSTRNRKGALIAFVIASRLAPHGIEAGTRSRATFREVMNRRNAKCKSRSR